MPGIVLHVKCQRHRNPDPPQHTMNVGYKDLLGTVGVVMQITRDCGCGYADYALNYNITSRKVPFIF